MKHIFMVLFVLLYCLTLSVHAEHDEEFFAKVRASGVIDDNETVVLSSNVYFYPDKKGHGFFSGGKSREKGHIIFTENGIYVLSWNRREKAYEVVHQEVYTELDSTEVTGTSPMVRLVTEAKSSEKYNSYELMDSRNALTPNVNKTKRANKIVSAGIKGFDVKQQAVVEGTSVAEAMEQKQRIQSLEERIHRLENANSASMVESKECVCECEK